MKAFHFHVSGRVQGVFFRASTEREARRLGLSGWVRNLRDGRVEGIAEGPEDALRELLVFLREGPPRAEVREVETEWTEPQALAAFHVRR